MKSITNRLITGFFCLATGMSVQAADFNYNYAQVTYDDIDFSIGQGVPELSGNGFSVSGAFEVTPDFYISADYRTYDLDFGVDLDVWDVGVGYHYSIDDKTDLVAGFAIGNIDLPTIDIDTWTLSAGVRHQLNNKVELGGQVKYVDYDGNDTDTRFGVNALYEFNKDINGILAFEFGDADVISIGARFDF